MSNIAGALYRVTKITSAKTKWSAAGEWGVVLARRPRMYPLQTGSLRASLSAVHGSWVPGRLLYTHSQPENEEVYWLDVPECIHYKLGVTVHRCLQYTAPEYLVDCCTHIPSRRMRSCTDSTSQNVSTTNWESQCIAVCSTRLLCTWSTAVHTFPAGEWGVVLTRRPRTYPLQTGSHSASLSAVQGSWVPGRLLYTHSQPENEELYLLDGPERIHYKLGVTVHSCLQYKAPEYLVDCCTPVSDIPSRCHLWSATRHHLTIPRYRLSTFGRRTFSVTGPMVWNSLLDGLCDPALSSNSFRQSLKTNLFQRYHSAHTAQ